MKKLELTLKQRELLLKMVRALYPEYNSVSVEAHWKGRIQTITEGIELNNDSIIFPYKAMGNTNPYIGHTYIHWFEFCMKVLGKKIIPEDNDDDIYYEFLGECCAGTTHPVDHLYEQFKKLK